MQLEAIVRKFVRLPWEAYRGDEHFKDRAIADYVAFEAFGKEHFKEKPAPMESNLVLQSIATTLFIAFTNGKTDTLAKRNRLHTLTQDERKFFLQKTAIIPAEHDSILLIVKKAPTMVRLASYIAAAYAFTTWTKPFVANFEKVTSIAYQSMRDGSKEEKDMRSAGLLIVTGLGSASKVNETPYAFLQDILTVRAMSGKMNMFIDLPSGTLMKMGCSKEMPTRQEVIENYLKMFPVSYRMHNHLVGTGVHMPFIDEIARDTDERRKTTVI